MGFSEKVKLEALKRADWRCVLCQAIWCEVHHIIPQEEDGPDDIDNAAPLCGSCHHQYGGNPKLRKQIRLRRDWWWERCENSPVNPNAEHLNKLFVEYREEQRHERTQDREERAEERKATLEQMKQIIGDEFRGAMESVESAKTLPDLVQASSGLSITTFAPTVRVDAVLVPSCPQCGAGLLSDGTCPSCGSSGLSNQYGTTGPPST